jgi:hypothetical protein
MNTKQAEKPKILAIGNWYSKRDCPNSEHGTRHSFIDVDAKHGTVKGEKLITSECKYCGGLIIDCPTIAAF